MFNAMSLTVLRQLLQKCLCRNFPVKRMPDSVTDALAAAVCHHFQMKFPTVASSTAKKPRTKKGGSSSWEAFISQNPDRVC